MKAITTHERADMDAIASLYAASLLYPEYQAVLPQKLNRNVRDLLALYKDELPFVERREIASRRISQLILVDTQAIAPLRGMGPATQIHIIDHHPPTELPPDATFEGETVGATTSLLIARIRRREIPVNKLGASLMLMGIYEDTGSLSYLTTTAKDAEAAAWLLTQGADLALVSQFLNRPLTNGQRDAFFSLVNNSTFYTVRGRSLCISMVELNEYVDELSTLIHELVDMYEPDACFLLAKYGDSVQMIARSANDAINVGTLMRAFGGGGHSKAAAALVQDGDLEELRDRLLAVAEENIEPPVLVSQIMSTNVHTLDKNMSVRDAVQLMQRYGHEGFPVVEGERLIGILTRRDIDRALHHRLGDMPVRSFLHTGPIHVRPDDPVDTVQRVMIEHDLGQVPVVEDGRFVGIVTRTDIIKLWTAPLYPSRADEIRQKMEEALPEGLQKLLFKARDTANDMGYSLYVVGGFVRDLLLGTPTLDLDLVVEGDAIRMARQLATELGGRLRSHSRFGTAKVILEGPREPGVPPSLDFVTARTEFYERPTQLPEIERSSIKQDLYRRDFTINTMAISLDRNRYGQLLDYYGGERDLHEGRIRVLHNLSFVEDPTRILRAVRFEQRLGFQIEERTAELIDDALDLLDHVTGERLRNELYLLLSEARPELALERLEQIGVLSHVHPALHYTREMGTLFARLRERFDLWAGKEEAEARQSAQEIEEENPDAVVAPTLALCYLAILTSPMKPQELDAFVAHVHIPRNDARFLHEVARLRESLSELTARAMLPSTIYHMLHPYSREARFVLSVLTDSPLVRKRLELYEGALSQVKLHIDGYFLKKLGVPPGPVYGEVLQRVHDALLDNQISTPEEEQQLARSLIESSHIATSRA
ncbi:MAG: CBS domain-containing protein [Chloroflexi bacterium]|nr:CBS domain-containing protein [Chloroflexota bacterium]